MNSRLAEQLGQNKKLSKQLDDLKNNQLTKLKEYEAQEALLAGRNSYSKTDLEHIDAPKPKRVCTDAGYGCEQNYEYAQDKGFDAYVKYPGYYQGKKQIHSNDPFHSSTLYYNKGQDFYVCPMGQRMTLQRIEQGETSTGYPHQVHVYDAQRCEGCPLRALCHKAKTDRILRVNHRAQHFREQAKERLDSLRGIRMRKKRNIDTEPIFGHVKEDRHFRRFLLRELQGVSTETGLLSIAHNLKKWWAILSKQGHGVPLPPDAQPNYRAIALKNCPIRSGF